MNPVHDPNDLRMSVAVPARLVPTLIAGAVNAKLGPPDRALAGEAPTK